MAQMQACAYCGCSFPVLPSMLKRGKGKYCSLDCANNARKNRVKRICEICGVSFQVPLSSITYHAARFCSVECAAKGAVTSISKECLSCGATFTIKPSKATTKRGKYCSRDCYNTWRTAHTKRILQICEVCGSEFQVFPTKVGRARFCSRSCAAVANSILMSGPDSPLATERITLSCEYCGKEFEVTQSKARLQSTRFCSKDCYSQWQSENWNGENHPSSWKGGISFEPYGVEFNDSLKQEVKIRDDYTCQLCWQVEAEVTFHIHHIDYDKTNNAPDNLITLCPSCHSSTGGRRAYWTKHLRRLFSEQSNPEKEKGQ